MMGSECSIWHRRRIFLGLFTALTTAASLILAHPAAAEEPGSAIEPAPAAKGAIRLDEIAFTDSGSVSGVLVNRSADVLRDVRLLIRYDWRWKNERSPGEDSPGRSTYFTVQGDVPALGTLPFQYVPAPPLPIRDDGHFAPSIEVARYTLVRYKRVTREPKP